MDLSSFPDLSLMSTEELEDYWMAIRKNRQTDIGEFLSARKTPRSRKPAPVKSPSALSSMTPEEKAALDGLLGL